MTTEKERKGPLDPIERTSYACGICGSLKDSTDEARKCAIEDTGKLDVDKVISRAPTGYPKIFTASFRTGVSATFAQVEVCELCDGSGEEERANGAFPCQRCQSTGWIVHSK